ncbi:hypothetical protein LMG26858_03622 [Achromobacter anxifer]|uniref:Uncharacterized protein n=1 Tax=Achromobacter anxifer TaxID=1287737 RepID=A0A6S7DKW2_9BURK|nr:hypothetical protein LMG26858_03622 [Achromobacter anxifer]CAB5513376.1 hypothetical protein LMG26857_02656 [Achromobacter anxifer]
MVFAYSLDVEADTDAQADTTFFRRGSGVNGDAGRQRQRLTPRTMDPNPHIYE